MAEQEVKEERAAAERGQYPDRNFMRCGDGAGCQIGEQQQETAG